MSRAPSRASSFASQHQDVSPSNTSLLGAAHAFSRPVAAERARSNTHVGADGARTAATIAGGSRKLPNSSILPNPTTNVDKNQQNRAATVAAGNASNSALRESIPTSANASDFLSPDVGTRPKLIRSPSQQAAIMAASRLSPQSQPLLQPQTQTRSRNSSRASMVKSPRPEATLQHTKKPEVPPKPKRLPTQPSVVGKDQPDLTARKSAKSLAQAIEHSEQRRVLGQRRPETIIVKPEKPLAIRSPKPIRNDGITSIFQLDLHPDEETKAPPSPKANDQLPLTPYRSRDDDDDLYVSAPERVQQSPTSIPRQLPKAPIQQPVEARAVRPLEKFVSAERTPSLDPQWPKTRSRPISIPDPSKRSQSQPQSVPSPPSAPSLAAQWHLLHPKRPTPLASGDELANALVASSIASSRTASPHKLDPALSSSRKHHTLSVVSRSPSPKKKGMRHTLREPESESSDSEEETHPYRKHHKKRFVRKHPHKHHEGDRKRWRDALTELERKRYEGVWAANKGLYCTLSLQERRHPTHPSKSDAMDQLHSQIGEEVSNIVVRDLWMRSRLPSHPLELIWNLVDSRKVGRLLKEEFVVGMWLVDQKLKGWKLPPKVGDSVWTSARGVGIKIRK